VSTVLIAHPSTDVYGSDHQLLESIDGLRDVGWVVTLCLPASGSLVELVRGSDVQRVPFAVLCKALLGLLPLLRPRTQDGDRRRAPVAPDPGDPS
jgi:hypothetical protein